MTRTAVPFIGALLVYICLDLSWITLTGQSLYRDRLPDIFLEDLALWPAVVFYLLYTSGLLVLIILPAARSGSLKDAMWRGGFFGAVAYATYDLTNQATLRGWSTTVTVADIAWGFVASAIVSAVGYGIARRRSAAA